MSGGRFALLIATGRYENPDLKQLRSPVRDAEGLAQVLQDPQIGDFDVETLVDRQQHEVNRAIERFFLDRSRDDLLLLHISCHGIKNDNGELHFATRDTNRELLASTAVSTEFLRTQMSRCRARSIVLLLDCCYSGAFLPGSKGDTMVHIKDELAGHGRVVLTATNRTEYAWEGDHLNELQPQPSQFTGAIIHGLRSGKADVNRDGLVSVHDLYEYVYEQMRASSIKQRPQMWAEIEYQVVVARSVLYPRQAKLSNRAKDSVVVADGAPPHEFVQPHRRVRDISAHPVPSRESVLSREGGRPVPELEGDEHDATSLPSEGPERPGVIPGKAHPLYPIVGPGYQAVLRFRAQDGSEQQLIRRSAPGTPHPEWQIFHELRAMNVPPDQVLELHTELESCELPGAYCARMIREQWPQARITSIAPYGTDHASRQQGMQQLIAHQGELHQVADGPARPAPVRAPLPPMQAAPPIPPQEVIAQELAAAFESEVFRFEQQAVSRQGVPRAVARTLAVAGLPLDMGPFFWAHAQPGRPMPTLAELAQERGVQPAADADSYFVMGSDFGRAICVQYGTANIVAVPVEAGPGGAPVPPQFVNTGLPEFQRCLALLGRMWRLRFGLNQEQAGRWTVDFQAKLASLDPAALGSPESWWSVLLEQMWDGLL